jgi:two-component system sensor histidine kinase PilS (NtrC family)
MTRGEHPHLHHRWIGATRVLTPVALFLSALVVPATAAIWAWLALHLLLDIVHLSGLLHRWRSGDPLPRWQEPVLGMLFCLDVWLVTLVVSVDGGLLSDFLLLFILTATFAGFVMRYRGAVIVSVVGTAMFGSLALGHLGLAWSGRELSPLTLGTALFRTFRVVGLGSAISFLTAYLAETVRAQRVLSEDQARDLVLARLDLDGVLNRLTYGVLVLDGDDKLLYFNQSACSILRHPLHPGARLQQILASEAWGAELVETARQVSVGAIPKVDREIRLNPSTWVQVQIAGQWIEGRLRNVVVALHDISAIRRMEEEVRSAERGATLGHMAARIAHEIRNPLASITGSAQLLGEDATGTDDDRQLLGLIRRESERLDRILSEFLDFSRPRTPSLRRVVVRELLEEVREMVVARMIREGRSDVEVKAKCPEGLEISIDRDMLVQILSNFALNAFQAIAAGHPGKVVLDASSDPEQVRFRVRDNGVGIPPEVVKKVGEAFFTTRQGGVGLGMAISRHLTTLLGGTFRVQSLEGRGTVVEVAFPQERTDRT